MSTLKIQCPGLSQKVDAKLKTHLLLTSTSSTIMYEQQKQKHESPKDMYENVARALFITAKNWKQIPPKIERRHNVSGHCSHMECYRVMKKRKPLLPTIMWVQLTDKRLRGDRQEIVHSVRVHLYEAKKHKTDPL
jgi:hypothetical protein